MKTSILGQDQNIKIISHAIDTNLPILLCGDTGTGKTTVIRELSLDQNKKLIRINLTGQTSTDEFVGKWLIKGKETVWQDGVLTQALRNGDWLLVDEINAALPEILFVLHSLLDDDKQILLAEKDGEIVRPAEGFRFFATMNPMEEYAGTKELNKAFLSRFPVVVSFEYPDTPTEIQILKDKAGSDDNISKLIVGVGRRLREAKARQEIYYTCSTRDLISWAALHGALGTEDSFKVSILNKSGTDSKYIADLYGKTVKPLTEKAKNVGVDSLAQLDTKVSDMLANLKMEQDKVQKLNETFEKKKEGFIKEVMESAAVRALVEAELSKE